MEAATFARPVGSRRATGAPPHPTFVRWLWLWITTLVLVVVVVIGFLLGIVSNLHSINKGLFSANSSVTNIRGDANPLPMFISKINGNLTAINAALKPIPAQGTAILASLNAIHGSLGQVESSLVDTSDSLVNTSGSLVNTSNTLVTASGTLGTISTALVGVSGTLTGVSGSLVNTSGKLVTINHRAGAINSTLIAAQGATDGTTKINAQLVSLLNNPSGLVAVNTDAGNILTGLQEANAHLNSICKAQVLNTVSLAPLVATGPCPAQ